MEANLDDWDGDLKSVTDAEETLQKDLDRYNSQHMKSTLGQLVKRAEGRESILEDIRQDIRQLIAQHKADIDEKCLQDLYVVDPQDDMEKIEKNIGHEYQQWMYKCCFRSLLRCIIKEERGRVTAVCPSLLLKMKT